VTILTSSRSGKPIKTRIHWNQQEKRWTAKTSKGCPRSPYILVVGGWTTEVKPHLKSNPRGFVLTNDKNTSFIDSVSSQALLNKYHTKQLIYNKKDMFFNVNIGDRILFTPDGAYILLHKK